jgi:hypothetical protein
VQISLERSAITAVLAAAAALAAGGCGLSVTSPDLFVLTRTLAARGGGSSGSLVMLVSDDGTIRCNSGPRKLMPDQLLLEARDLANNLDQDAKARLQLPGGSNSVYAYQVRIKDGTISFADTAAAKHPELARLEQFTLEAARGPCGLGS